METTAHALVMVVTCGPILVANFLFKEGIEQFGRFGLDSGMLPPHSIAYYFHIFMLISSVICWLLLFSLILHYISHEFTGKAIPVCKMLMQNPISKFFFKSWTGFYYLQLIMFWMSSVMLCVFAISGAVGLILHLFSNMFMVTALIGLGTTAYLQFCFFAEIVSEVHAEIHHAQIIMEDLVAALAKRLMALRLKGHDGEHPEKAAKLKKKISDMQKAILMVQSGFSNCVTHELHEAGFGPKEFAMQIGGALVGASVIVTIVYSGMKAAHLFGKAVEAAGSALAGGALAVMNASKGKPPKKGPPKFPPKVQLAITKLNEALQILVKDSVTDLVYMLRHESHCQDILTGALAEAKKDMDEEKEDAWAQKNAQEFIKSANEGLKAGKAKVSKHKKEKAAKKAKAIE